MKDLDKILDVIDSRERMLSSFSTIYRHEDERAARLSAQKDVLKKLKRLIAGDEYEPHNQRRPDGEFRDPVTCDWAAVIVQALGVHTVQIFGTTAAATQMRDAIHLQHEGRIEDSIRCHVVRVDVTGLSPQRQASTEPRFAYAFVCETGQNYEHVSLVDTLEQIHALEEEFRKDCAYEFEQEDAHCTRLGVALPRLKKTSP